MLFTCSSSEIEKIRDRWINFNTIFSLTQYVQIVIISTSNQYKILTGQFIFFLLYCLEIWCIWWSYSSSKFRHYIFIWNTWSIFRFHKIYTGILWFTGLHFIALNRCCVLSQIKGKTLHQQKGYDSLVLRHSLYCGGLKLNPPYLRCACSWRGRFV